MDHGTDPGALQNVRQVARQPVRHVDRRMRQLSQPLAERDARLGLVQPLRRFPDLGVSEGERRAAEFARNPDIVAGPRAGAEQRSACRDFPERGDIDHEKRSARCIATDQVDPMAVCERE